MSPTAVCSVTVVRTDHVSNVVHRLTCLQEMPILLTCLQEDFDPAIDDIDRFMDDIEAIIDGNVRAGGAGEADRAMPEHAKISLITKYCRDPDERGAIRGHRYRRDGFLVMIGRTSPSRTSATSSSRTLGMTLRSQGRFGIYLMVA